MPWILLPEKMHRFLLILGLALPLPAFACPDLAPFYRQGDEAWAAVIQRLAPLMRECLQSSEYFALVGAAQLNAGRLANAVEALERALLLQPENGAAQIDYAQALFEQGQLYSALALNEQILARDDLPADLQPMLQARQRRWQSLTRQTSFQADFMAGYDNNLNGAPDPAQVTLTLSGESILLNLNEDFRPVSGPYLNFQLSGLHRRLQPLHQHNFGVDLRGRVSEDSQSDLLLLATRYNFIRPNRQHAWQADASMRHLFFGGNPLFTATETSFRYQPETLPWCRPYYDLALQHQAYHEQSRLNALETKLGVGADCPISRNGNGAQQLLRLEASLLGNNSLKDNRPGDDRYGWQFSVDWQMRLRDGSLRAQLSYTDISDQNGYSPLLAGGARRWIQRSYGLLQYRRPLGLGNLDAAFVANLYHQDQDSNLELFQSRDTAFEVGLSLRF